MTRLTLLLGCLLLMPSADACSWERDKVLAEHTALIQGLDCGLYPWESNACVTFAVSQRELKDALLTLEELNAYVNRLREINGSVRMGPSRDSCGREKMFLWVVDVP